MKHKPLVQRAVIASVIAVSASTILLLPPSKAEPSAPTIEASTPKTVVPAADWLEGTPDEQLARVSAHLRGLDMVMVETGHRYLELHWAGKDENWDYAAYQLDKIRLTLELGIERRPPRAASAQGFLKGAVPHLREAIEAENPAMFRERFQVFTAQCNACHAMEQVSFMHVRPPAQRSSPIHALPQSQPTNE